MEEKSVLITGATGFLGGYAVDEFLANGYTVYAMGRNVARGMELEARGAHFVCCDLGDEDVLAEWMQMVRYVAHVGAKSTVWGQWKDFEASNITGTENVARAAVRAGVEKLVYVSSPSIYSGNRDRLDITEDDFDTGNDLNYYIRSKIISEERLHLICSGKIAYNIIRPRGLVGVGDTSVIPRLIRANKKIGIPLLNGGQNLVDMTSVENAAYALRLCLEADDPHGSVYNITNGEPRVFVEILQQLFDDMGEKPRFRRLNYKLIYGAASALEKWYILRKEYDKEPALTRYTVCTLGHSQTLNIDKARQQLGYTPKVTLNETIKKYAEHYREHRKN